MIIRKITQYVASEGQRIEELKLIDSATLSAPTNEQIANLVEEERVDTLYIGVIIIPVGVNDANGEMIDVRPQELRFPINAQNLTEAFDKFARATEDAVSDLKKRSEEQTKKRDSGLIVPNAAETEAINNMRLVTPE